MSGHRPFRELTRDFAPEQRRHVEEIKRELLAELKRREREAADTQDA